MSNNLLNAYHHECPYCTAKPYELCKNTVGKHYSSYTHKLRNNAAKRMREPVQLELTLFDPPTPPAKETKPKPLQRVVRPVEGVAVELPFKVYELVVDSVLHTTDKAVLFSHPTKADTAAWVPKVVIQDCTATETKTTLLVNDSFTPTWKTTN